MARQGAARGAARAGYVALPPRGTVRMCAGYQGEILRHRVITADGLDVAVVTVKPAGSQTEYLTAAYPVQQGYLVMARQPLCELRSADEAAACDLHGRLVRVLAEAGAGVVRARRALAARQRAEGREVRELGMFVLGPEFSHSNVDDTVVASR